MELHFKTRYHPIIEFYLISVLRPKLLKIPLAYCFLINLDVLIQQIAHFDNIILLPLLAFETLGFILFVFFYTLNSKMKLFNI